jgi:uncharacterized C2H2 Zn-finger protein
VFYIVARKQPATGENRMHCPKCNSTEGIEIDMHSDGYAKDLLECTACGALWLDRFGEIIHLNQQQAA